MELYAFRQGYDLLWQGYVVTVIHFVTNKEKPGQPSDHTKHWQKARFVYRRHLPDLKFQKSETSKFAAVQSLNFQADANLQLKYTLKMAHWHTEFSQTCRRVPDSLQTRGQFLDITSQVFIHIHILRTHPDLPWGTNRFLYSGYPVIRGG
jgi:hypothetical protein